MVFFIIDNFYPAGLIFILIINKFITFRSILSSKLRSSLTKSPQPLLRDRRQKTLELLSRLCLLRWGGGQDKSAKNCQFPDESLLFQVALVTKQRYESMREGFYIYFSVVLASIEKKFILELRLGTSLLLQHVSRFS